jgi:hypothetical protein
MRASFRCLRATTPSCAGRPTDSRFAFRLRPEALPLALPASADAIAAATLEAADSVRFATQVQRWGGPEDELEDGSQPYVGQQLTFEAQAWDAPVDLESVLKGVVQVSNRHWKQTIDNKFQPNRCIAGKMGE